MRQAWLNSILHLSSHIYKQKSEILGAGLLMSLFLSFYIIFLELLLFIFSLPTYFLFSSKSVGLVKGYDAEVNKYRLQRKVTLTVILSVAGIFLLKIVLVFLISLFFSVPAAS